MNIYMAPESVYLEGVVKDNMELVFWTFWYNG